MGKLLGVVNWVLNFKNPPYFYFRRFLVGDFVWTCLTALLGLNILDWMEVISMIGVHSLPKYDRRKYIPIFCISVICSLLLGSLDVVGSYVQWQFTPILVYAYGLTCSCILGLVFFVASQAVINELAKINIEAGFHIISRLEQFRWSVVTVILCFLFVSGIRLIFKYYFKTNDPEIFLLAVSEVLMSALPSILCYFIYKRLQTRQQQPQTPPPSEDSTSLYE